MTKKKKTMCHRPWEEIVIYPDYEYSICCAGPIVGKLSGINEIANMWNSGEFVKYRRNLLNNIEDGICKECVYYKTLRNVEREEAYEEGVFSNNPEMISMILTEQCNLKCFMCGYTKKYKRANRIKDVRMMDIEFCREFAKNYFRKAKMVNTNCGGEIFLYPHLDEFLEILKEYQPGVVTSTSNGSFDISEEMWYKILETHDCFNFSLDSMDVDVHYTIRGFDINRVFKNIDKIKNIKKEHFPFFKYGFNMVIMKMTIHGLLDFAKKAVNDLGADNLGFQHVTGFEEQSVSNDKEWRILYNIKLKQLKEFLEKTNTPINGPLGYFYDKDGNIEGERKIIITKTTNIKPVERKPKNSFLGAFYYAWYSGEWERQCARYNRYDVEPSLGYYESKDSNIIQNHAEEANSHGIDFFISSFNGYNSFEELEFLADNLGDFPFVIHYETVNIFPDPVKFDKTCEETLRMHFHEISRRLISRKNYYRIDGKPVIFIYTSRRIIGDLSEIDLIRATCKKELQVECIIVGDEMWWQDEEWIGDIERLKKFDYIYPYNLYTPDGTNGNEKFTGKQYLDLIEPVYQNFYEKAQEADIGLIPNILPRYNDESVRNNKGHYPLPSYGTKFYEDYFKMCSKYFLGDYNILTITSFNEWYEDTQIESTGKSYNGNVDDYDDNPNYGDVFLQKTLEFKNKMQDKDMAKLVKYDKINVLDAIKRDREMILKPKFREHIVFKFKEYDEKDSGSILYFMNKREDPIIAFHKNKKKLHILFHNGERWDRTKTDIPCLEDFEVEIRGHGLGDVYVNGEKLANLENVSKILPIYHEVVLYQVHNKKFPDPEPKKSKMEKFILKQER